MSLMMLCLLIVSSSITAQIIPQAVQNPGKSEIRLFIEKASKVNSAYKKQVSEYLITGLKIHDWNGASWEAGADVELTYTSGKLLTRTVRTWTGFDWIVTEKKTNGYQDDVLTSELYEELNFMDKLVPVERYLYEYEAGTSPKIISEIIYQYHDGENWINDYKDIFQVTNNMISGGTSFYWEDDEWVEESHFNVEEENDSTTITYQSWTGSEWENEDREIYPDLTIDELYQLSFSQNVTMEIPIFLMNSQIPDYTYQEWDGDDWVDVQMQYTSYESTSNQLTEAKFVNTIYWDGEDWTPGSALKFYYNEKVNPDSSELSYFDHIYGTLEWRIIMKEHYTYNEEGLYKQVIGRIDTSAIGVVEKVGYDNLYKYEFEWNGISTGINEPAKPAAYRLNPAYPNPFNPTTNITYSLERAGEVNIQVYDVLGRYLTTLSSGFKPAGEYHVQFDANNLSSGLYIVRMEAAGFLKTQMVTLLK